MSSQRHRRSLISRQIAGPDCIVQQDVFTMKIRFRLPFDASRQSGLTTPLRLLLATTAACWMGAAQPQVATTALGRTTTGLRFQDLFPMPIGRTGPQISDLVRLASGSVVRLVGYMVQQDSPAPGRFMLAQRPVPGAARRACRQWHRRHARGNRGGVS